LPQALIIGAQKCGTSALAKYLSQHPHLLHANEKELEFFGSDRRYGYGLAWYAQQWPEQEKPWAMRFEASPHYLFAPVAAPRIRECLPDVRLIALVRDPVQRAYSAWQMYRRQLAADPLFYRKLITSHYSEAEADSLVRRTTEELNDFWLAVKRELAFIDNGKLMEWSVVELGLYGPQLQRFFDIFPREQLLVIPANDLRQRRVATLNRVLAHLRLPTHDWSRADLSDVFVGGWSGAVPPQAGILLERYYATSNSMLEGMMDDLPGWARLPRRHAA